MVVDRISAVLLANVLFWQSATGQESAFIDLQSEGQVAPALQTKPLTVSGYPTTMSVALSRRLSCLRSVDVNGNVWQWQLHPLPEPELIAATNSELFCAVLSNDAERLAFADADARVTLMDLDSRQVKFRDDSQSGNTATLCFSPDSDWLAAATSDGSVRVWNAASGSVVREYQVDPGPVQSLAFSPDGRLLAVASFSRDVRLFDLTQRLVSSASRVIAIDDSRITAIGFTPGGKQLVVAAADGTAFVCEINKEQKRVTLDSHPFATWSLGFDDDGQRMVAGSWDGAIRVWDTSSWRMIQKLKGHEESVSTVNLSRQGMISTGLDGRMQFWPAQIPGSKLKGMITGPADPVWVAVYSPDGKRLFLGGRGERFEIWNVETNERMFSTKRHSTTRCAVFSPDGRLIATGGAEGEIFLSSVNDGQILHTLKGHPGAVSAVLFVDDGKTLISGCDQGHLKFWDTATGKETASRHRHKQQLYCASVSPDQKWLVTGGGHWAKGDPGELIVWDLQKRQFKAALQGHRLTVWSVVFAIDGEYFAVSDSAGDVKVWNTESLTETRTVHHDTWVRPMAMSPDGRTLAVGRGDGPIQLWDTTTWTEKGSCIGYDSFTFWLQYSPDGKTLATAGNDGTLRFWETQ